MPSRICRCDVARECKLSGPASRSHTHLRRGVGHTPHHGAARRNPFPHHRDGRSGKDRDEELALERFGHPWHEQQRRSELRLAAGKKGDKRTVSLTNIPPKQLDPTREKATHQSRITSDSATLRTLSSPNRTCTVGPSPPSSLNAFLSFLALSARLTVAMKLWSIRVKTEDGGAGRRSVPPAAIPTGEAQLTDREDSPERDRGSCYPWGCLARCRRRGIWRR